MRRGTGAALLVSAVLLVGGASPALARHRDERSRCYDDCEGSGNGNSGYDGEGGRSGDTNQRGDRNCRNFCGNVIVIPNPVPGGSQPEEPR